jgi:hypothetical protein
MTKPNERIVTLLYKPLAGEFLTPEEEKELDDWIAGSVHHRVLYEELLQPEKLKRELRQLMHMEWQPAWKRITVKISDTE